MNPNETSTPQQLLLGQNIACRDNLYTYVRQAWHIIQPSTPFIDNWHIQIICEYLQAVTEHQISNLIINIPPRHMKSLLVSVFWPTWSWIKNPALRWLTGSYAISLATHDATISRRLILSPWYRQNFGHLFTLTTDQNAKHRYDNNKTGYRLAFSFNTAVTGEGADILVVDDPLKAQDADSPAHRNRVNDTYDITLTTRANDPRLARRVIIMQRLHPDDLTGHLLEKHHPSGTGAPYYEHLCLPTEYEPQRYISTIGLNDPRTQPGELLWPARFGPAENAAAKLDLGARAYAGQHAQRPAPLAGGIYQTDWWRGRNRADPKPQRVIARWLSWDTAFKDAEQNDTSALTVCELLDDYSLFLRYASWQRLQFPQLASAITDEALRWNTDDKLRGILIEDKASGISVLQTLQQSAPAQVANLLKSFTPGQTSKAARARQASLWCERSCILLPHPTEQYPWLYDFENLLYSFPTAKINDPIDSFTQTILYLENYLAEGWRCRNRIE